MGGERLILVVNTEDGVSVEGDRGKLAHDVPPTFSIWHLGRVWRSSPYLMRKAGTQLPRWTATLISRAGFVFGVIDPAKYAGRKGIIAQKETQQKSRAGARVILKQRRGHCQRDSEVAVAVSVGECQGEFLGIAQRERLRARNRVGTAGALLLTYSSANIEYGTRYHISGTKKPLTNGMATSV